MTQYSYRKISFFAILTIVLAISPVLALAQFGKQRDPVLRGTAVLESSDKGWRLIPICIYSSGKFYDADFYQSTPAPMSLIQDTIYEVQKSGAPIGTFKVNQAERLGAAWYGLGSYTDFSATPTDNKVTTAKGTVELKNSGPDDRPVMHRAKPAPPEPAPAAATPSRDDAKMANEDPQRPILKRGTQAPAPELAGPKEDPEAKAETARRTLQLNVAVSDPSTRSTRPFDYQWDDNQKQHLTEVMTKMASAELSKVGKSRGVTLAPREQIEFAEKSVRAYDVDYSNNPQLVLVARFIPSQRQVAGLSKDSAMDVMKRGIFVTLVARVNYDGQLERIFSEISDPRDLDLYPRMEFVDAVDVDADNRAELLFAKDSESGRRFVVYRLYGLQMNELFTSGVR